MWRCHGIQRIFAHVTPFEGAVAHFPYYTQWLAGVLHDLSSFDVRRRLHALCLSFVKDFTAFSYFSLWNKTYHEIKRIFDLDHGLT